LGRAGTPEGELNIPKSNEKPQQKQMNRPADELVISRDKKLTTTLALGALWPESYWWRMARFLSRHADN
jgi:hypothetical protein